MSVMVLILVLAIKLGQRILKIVPLREEDVIYRARFSENIVPSFI